MADTTILQVWVTKNALNVYRRRGVQLFSKCLNSQIFFDFVENSWHYSMEPVFLGGLLRERIIGKGPVISWVPTKCQSILVPKSGCPAITRHLLWTIFASSSSWHAVVHVPKFVNSQSEAVYCLDILWHLVDSMVIISWLRMVKTKPYCSS